LGSITPRMPRSVEYIKQRYATLMKLLEQEFPEKGVDTENDSDIMSDTNTTTETLKNALRPNQKQTD
jgi:hypothetical protein